MKVRGWRMLSALAIMIALAGCSRADPSIIAAAPEPSGGAPGGGPQTLNVAADAAALKFQQETLTAAADQQINVVFQNPAQLQHNWVLAQPGQEQAVADAAAAKNGDPTGVPGTIAAGAILNAGAQEEIQVPPTPAGSYTYLCTVPGHFAAGMKGTLTLGAAAEGAAGGASAAPAASPAGGGAAPSAAPAAGAGAEGGLTESADPSGALKFQQAALQVQAGQPFSVAFNNPSPLQHNWVLVEPGQEDAVANAAAAKNGDPTGIPGVIAGKPPVNGGSNDTIDVPPQQAGDYPYICTVPGHYAAGMKGQLTVAP